MIAIKLSSFLFGKGRYLWQKKYKLGKMTKAKFVENKAKIDDEIEELEEKMKVSVTTQEVVTDTELTREMMGKYIDSVIVGGEESSMEMRYEDENIWLTQKMMAVLYDVGTNTINYNTNHYSLEMIIAVGFKVNMIKQPLLQNDFMHQDFFVNNYYLVFLQKFRLS